MSPLDPAVLHLALGERDATFVYLEEAFRIRAPFLSHVKTDPSWRPLHGDSRFTELLRKMRLL